MKKPQPTNHIRIVMSSSRDRLLLLECRETAVSRALQQFGTVIPAGPNRLQVHVSRQFHMPDVKRWIRAWEPSPRPSERELLEELTNALEAALQHVEGVDTAVTAQWEATLQRGRGAL
jgi:hypothetical protein